MNRMERLTAIRRTGTSGTTERPSTSTSMETINVITSRLPARQVSNLEKFKNLFHRKDERKEKEEAEQKLAMPVQFNEVWTFPEGVGLLLSEAFERTGFGMVPAVYLCSPLWHYEGQPTTLLTLEAGEHTYKVKNTGDHFRTVNHVSLDQTYYSWRQLHDLARLIQDHMIHNNPVWYTTFWEVLPVDPAVARAAAEAATPPANPHNPWNDPLTRDPDHRWSHQFEFWRQWEPYTVWNPSSTRAMMPEDIEKIKVAFECGTTPEDRGKIPRWEFRLTRGGRHYYVGRTNLFPAPMPASRRIIEGWIVENPPLPYNLHFDSAMVNRVLNEFHRSCDTSRLSGNKKYKVVVNGVVYWVRRPNREDHEGPARYGC